jgi:hypothetical protein
MTAIYFDLDGREQIDSSESDQNSINLLIASGADM